MALCDSSWSSLPDHILVHSFGYLPLSDRWQACLVCKSWAQSFRSPYLWQQFKFIFYTPYQKKFLKCLDIYGKYLKYVCIELDQALEENRTNACSVLLQLAATKERRLTKLTIKFEGENPLFYAGREFYESLSVLFGPVKDDIIVTQDLKYVDLSGLSAAFDDELIDKLSDNNRKLCKLNMQNKSLVCKVTPRSLLRLIQRCRKLKDLSVFNSSMNEDVLLALTEVDRDPFDHLSIKYRREEKYLKDIPSETWGALSKKLPNLRVTMRFDHTVPLLKIQPVLKKEIPASGLHLETYSIIYDELNHAVSHYKRTLEKVVLNTRPSKELNEALINLAKQCENLNSLYVFCHVEKATVEEIHKQRPSLEKHKKYVLNWE